MIDFEREIKSLRESINLIESNLKTGIISKEEYNDLFYNLELRYCRLFIALNELKEIYKPHKENKA